jgi:nucleotidyltransferase/DNA polymerase involved in DNA repair
MEDRQRAIKELQIIPGIGKSLAEDLWNIGIRSVADLRNNNPEKLYKKLERFENKHVDRCVLYTFRCAVYYASRKKYDPKLLKWWNWKDRTRIRE